MMGMIEKLIYGAAAIIFIVGVGFYLQHIWSDCMDENSILTCMRMLNKLLQEKYGVTRNL